MCWDLDAKDINMDEDDGRIWVLVTPWTLEEGIGNEGKNVLPRTEEDSTGPNEGRNTICTMSMYAVTDGLDGVIQATMPVSQVVETLESTC